MANKKTSPKKSTTKKTVITKIAGQIGSVAGGLAAHKDHLVEMAGDALESAKSTILDITAKKTAPKKTAKPAAKKSTTKTARPVAKKTTRVAPVKKAAPLKKAIKKVAKKISAKK